MKLTIELVPSNLWGFSVFGFYNLTNPDKWKNIRKDILRREGNQCWICGNRTKRLEAHEFWYYDERSHIQRLAEIHLLCSLCHRIKHIGRWCYTEDGRREFPNGKEILIKHFIKTNRCSLEEFNQHERESFQIFNERSRHEWTQDFGVYEEDMRNYLLNKQLVNPKM